MPKLPVGQHEVKNWPVLDLGEQPDVSTDTWKLELGGLVENPATLTWDQFLSLPQVEDVSDFHCVTTWSRFDNHWRGVRFKTIAELAGRSSVLSRKFTGSRIPSISEEPSAMSE